jgi:hypothetical protein
MKISNITHLHADGPRRLYLKDLKFLPEAQTEGRRSDDLYLDPVGQAPLVRQGIYVPPRTYIYLPDTSEVLRSASYGDIHKWVAMGYLQTHDRLSLTAVGGLHDTEVLTHNLGYAPTVVALKQVGITWIDATGTVDIVHNANFTTVTISNPTGVALVLLIKIS